MRDCRRLIGARIIKTDRQGQLASQAHPALLGGEARLVVAGVADHLLEQLPVEASTRPTETGVAHDLPRDFGVGHRVSREGHLACERQRGSFGIGKAGLVTGQGLQTGTGYSVTGTGTGYTTSSDQAHVMVRSVDGDSTMVARLTALGGSLDRAVKLLRDKKPLAIVVTLGLATPWAVIRTLRYRAQKTALLVAGGLDQFVAAQAADVDAAGEEVGEMFGFDFSL